MHHGGLNYSANCLITGFKIEFHITYIHTYIWALQPFRQHYDLASHIEFDIANLHF